MNLLVLQTDFGLVDGAVSAMKGVAKQVHPQLEIFDLTHDIPPYDIWSASYRIIQTVKYWPQHTVFVSVVDPGVGSDRRSIVIETTDEHYVITPDNGSLSHLYHDGKINRAFVIDEVKSRLPHSQESHTFHGRDIYAYNGARLASGEVTIEEIGHEIELESLVSFDIENPTVHGRTIHGKIDILDIRFGSLWTNIPLNLLQELDIHRGDYVLVEIFHGEQSVYQNMLPFVRSFAEVTLGQPLLYVNSLVNLGVAVNQDSFSALYHIGYGSEWNITLRKITKEQLEIFNKE